jgi:hypothetical protein
MCVKVKKERGTYQQETCKNTLIVENVMKNRPTVEKQVKNTCYSVKRGVYQ